MHGEGKPVPLPQMPWRRPSEINWLYEDDEVQIWETKDGRVHTMTRGFGGIAPADVKRIAKFEHDLLRVPLPLRRPDLLDVSGLYWNLSRRRYHQREFQKTVAVQAPALGSVRVQVIPSAPLVARLGWDEELVLAPTLATSVAVSFSQTQAAIQFYLVAGGRVVSNLCSVESASAAQVELVRRVSDVWFRRFQQKQHGGRPRGWRSVDTQWLYAQIRRAHDSGWPTNRKVAENFDVSVSTVQRALRATRKRTVT
jgi:hypothetical protein